MSKIDPELLKKLEEMGFDKKNLGDWKFGENVNFTPSFVESHQKMLKSIQGFLEVQVNKDLKSVDYLREVLKRIERGGGS
jgi:hypothetical protein